MAKNKAHKSTEYNNAKNDHLIAYQTTKAEFAFVDHLGISYTETSDDDGLHNVYVYGTDNKGEIQAKYLNNHPEMLMKFLNNQGFKIARKEELRKPVEDNQETKPKRALCFDNEKEYQQFMQEIQGSPSCERKKQLTQTRCLINKHRSLLNGFESKIKRHVEMKIDKAPWLLEQLMSWTNQVPNDTESTAAIHEYLFEPIINQTIKQENIHVVGSCAPRPVGVDDPDTRSPEFHMVADQLQANINIGYERENTKHRAIFAISPKTELYKFLTKLYGSHINMDKALKNDGWFKPGDNARKNGVIDYFCDSYWKIPEMDDYVGDTIRKAFPKGLYDKISITIKAKNK